VEVEFPRGPDPSKFNHTVVLRTGTYPFVHLRTLNGCLIVLFPFVLLDRYIQPRGSAPKEGDNVTARLQVTCPGPCITCFI